MECYGTEEKHQYCKIMSITVQKNYETIYISNCQEDCILVQKQIWDKDNLLVICFQRNKGSGNGFKANALGSNLRIRSGDQKTVDYQLVAVVADFGISNTDGLFVCYVMCRGKCLLEISDRTVNTPPLSDVANTPERYGYLYLYQNCYACNQNYMMFQNLGHILTLNTSKTIKDITLMYSESLQSQVFHRMFKDVQCEHRWPPGTHQAYSPNFAKCIPALRCRWLQQLPLFGPSVHPHLLEREADRPVLPQTFTKTNRRV